MSEQNVETVRRSNAAFNRGDRERAFADYHPDVEWRDLQHAPDAPAVVRGIEAVYTIWDQWNAVFEEFTAELEECVESGDFVAAVVRWRARGAASGLTLDLHTADLYEFRDGQVVRVTLGYPDKGAALAAAGPRPGERSAPDLVELTRRSMEAANRGDLDPSATSFAPDAVFDVSSAGLGRFEGTEAIHRYLADWTSSYEKQELRRWDGRDLGGGVVFVVTLFEARPRDSPSTVREEWAFTVTWTGGMITLVSASRDLEAARATAEGLAAARA